MIKDPNSEEEKKIVREILKTKVKELLGSYGTKNLEALQEAFSAIHSIPYFCRQRMTKKDIKKILIPYSKNGWKTFLEALVVYSHYFKHKTFREIGEVLKVTKQRVDQIEKRACEEIRKKLLLEKCF